MATLLRGLYYGGSVFSDMKKQKFMSRYQVIAEQLVAKNEGSIKIACLKEDSSVILGYAIVNNDGTVLHFVFCKKPWRGIGVIKDLVPNTVTTVTHLTKTGMSILKKKQLEYDPFSL